MLGVRVRVSCSLSIGGGGEEEDRVRVLEGGCGKWRMEGGKEQLGLGFWRVWEVGVEERGKGWEWQNIWRGFI